MVKGYAAEGPETIGNHIHDIGISKRNKILVNFIADAVKRCGKHTEPGQQSQVIFNPQGLICPVK